MFPSDRTTRPIPHTRPALSLVQTKARRLGANVMKANEDLASARAASSRWLLRNRTDVLLVLLALVVVGPWVQQYTASSASRYVLSAAIWDDHTFDLTSHEAELAVDKVEIDGELRSDKAPLQPVLAAPVYGIYRAAGGEPSTAHRIHGNLGLWWVTLWSSVIPFAAVLVMMRRLAVAAVGNAALSASVALGFGTLMLPYAAELYGHLSATALVFGMWLVVRDRALTATRLLIAGLLGGAAIATEYQTALVVAVVVLALLRRADKKLVWLALGASVPLLLLALYQWIAFGDPTTIPYMLKAQHQHGIVGISVPSPRYVISIFVGRKGLISTGPSAILAVAGAIWALTRQRGAVRRDAIVALAAFAGLLWVQSGGSDPPYGGESVGPRYLIPALPFLVVPLAAVWARIRTLCIVTAVYGVIAMSAALITLHLVPRRLASLPVYIDRVQEGEVVPNVLSMMFGTTGTILLLGLIVAAITALWFDATRHRADLRTVGSASSTGEP